MIPDGGVGPDPEVHRNRESLSGAFDEMTTGERSLRFAPASSRYLMKTASVVILTRRAVSQSPHQPPESGHEARGTGGADVGGR